MLFIKPYTNDRKTTSNMEPLSPLDQATGDDAASQVSASSVTLEPSRSLESIEELEVVQLPEPVQTSDEQILTHTAKRPKRPFPQHRNRRYQGSFESEMLEAAKRLGQKKEMSEEEHFFKILVPKLQEMSPFDKMECQAEIHMVVLKYMRRRAPSANLGTNGHSDNDPHPSTSTAINFNDVQQYQYNQCPVTETSNRLSSSYGQYRQYPDY